MITIRALQSSDRADLVKILNDTDMFIKAEIDVALELIDTALNKPNQTDYIIRVAVDNSQVMGYVCFGPTPATAGTYDLYWIAVAPHVQGKGIGKELLNHVETEVHARCGYLIVIETSSREKYLPTRNFYLKNGYTVAAQIKDFYRPGDDRVIFVKYFKEENK
ncbi:MAG: GNAT family N-acetyltransferase [Candidatus Marinimicrobia bacterium]|jgi:ribosomal protein S18 acetylase RimI-like enzyme|nr:GNAT family N-acetyltransferase [Candidatus Neomarinimicrobiota bacterium]MCK9484728.1 GNAT family N-acetyltransferase [Candidatus Neomarinimicrobiota bacterium]MCK9559439.1 GNAT family N-acetyltransferase [Candidatus Neomarinimicrobiota bacterium]MDD5061153.1 GNAT family N-acetyltransferase [Candidatus Neomarinimicrobiota bacterium]MDD5539625.1 GNAT family N-acetyltransferase [Candidatus Neomarinimicrobiota bacterium]